MMQAPAWTAASPNAAVSCWMGITIDVAYRFFATPTRRFIVADTPGHEQYTRNMATGASTADAAILLIDARKGVLPQTKRHSRIVSMLGIRHVALAINKMDLVDWSKDVFEEIELAYRRFAQDLGFQTIRAIPVSALEGQNVVQLNQVEMRWYEGQTLLNWLETVPVAHGSPNPAGRRFSSVGTRYRDWRAYSQFR